MDITPIVMHIQADVLLTLLFRVGLLGVGYLVVLLFYKRRR
jgi:hypothetical protein